MSGIKKQQNKLEKMNKDNSILNISNLAVFKDNFNSAYLYKKTEKLVSALYLLSSFISDKEKIKWQIREAGTELLSSSVTLSFKSSSETITTYPSFIFTGLKLLSFLEIAYAGAIISGMNYDILKYELETLIQNVESYERENGSKGLVLSDEIFKVNNTNGDLRSAHNSVLVDKGHKSMSDSIMSFNKPVETVRASELKEKDKSKRQEIIIGLLKKNLELGIKDFVLAIKDCSEKTVQRELACLVSKGQIKKEGEKRWSRYSLK